jgi:hypothetical protein
MTGLERRGARVLLIAAALALIALLLSLWATA